MKKKMILALAALLILCLGGAYAVNTRMNDLYEHTLSLQVTDRHGEIILLEPNTKNYVVLRSTSLAPKFRDLLLQKEDRFFFFHLGFNPISMGRALLSRMDIGERDGSSTITQQLAKLVLATETDRTIFNKIRESVGAVSMELFNSKDKILARYANSVYMGNQIQGIETASRAYFALPSDKLGTEQILQILVTLNNPSYTNPLLETNIPRASAIAKALKVEIDETFFVQPEAAAKNFAQFSRGNRAFEIESWLTDEVKARKDLSLTLDIALMDDIREIAAGLMPGLYKRDAHAAAVVVLDARTNEILALVGSPNPSSTEFGQQINMALEPRQVASTIKPLLYARAYEAGMRPYTQIDDKMYAYTTADGRILYPRNFDGKYRGIVSADYALANSINVPAIKTLEFLGQDNFMQFMAKLGYRDPAKILDHQLGAALGTIDMTLLEQTHFYSIFPNSGKLLPLKLFADEGINRSFFPVDVQEVIGAAYTQLVTKTLSDRYIAIDQFGYTSALSLPFNAYALKTGTSDDHRDTWVIGYTPDFIVGTWVGNTDNSPTKNLSGQTGAGEIWSAVMQLLAGTEYHRSSSFSYDLIRPYSAEERDTYGLEGDDFGNIQRLLLDRK